MIRLNHTADAHFRRERATDFFASLDVLQANAKDADLTIIAGDLFDSPVQNTGASQFPDLAERLKSLSVPSPVIMVEGTPTHDSDGCLDVFETVSDRITVLRLGEAYILSKRRGVCVLAHDAAAKGLCTSDYDQAIIFGIPEPRKKWLQAADADATLDQLMRTILAGYAAIRQRYANLPCILVYHGHVRGTKMPNGQPIDDGISIDDLAMVGADYYALGDIHKPQRVGEKRGLHAYYPGSMFATKDWNEADIEFGFNRVEIDVGSVKVERVSYPHPLHKKIEVSAPFVLSSGEFRGAKTWIEISATAEEAAAIDCEAVKASLLAFGAHPDSRVTIKRLTSATVRAGEISILKKLREKFSLWMLNSKKTPTPAMLEKCDQVEIDAAGQGVVQAGGAFTFDYLRLRGAKGIWKKQRKDEIVVELASCDPGIVGLIGPNGRGKSTIFNAFHMWSEFPSYPGPAYKCFRLKDSLWEVQATDHATGTQYRKRILMDPTLKTPSAKYYLDTRPVGTEEWTPDPRIDGSLSAYNEVIASTFGSLELYIRTAYQMQEPTADYPDISKANKTTKKAIMAELAGLMYHVYKGIVETKRKAIDTIVHDKDTRISVLEESLGFRDALDDDLRDARKRHAELSAEFPIMQARLGELAAALAIAQRRAADMTAIKDQITRIDTEIEQDRRAMVTKDLLIATLRDAIAGKTAAEKTIAEYQVLKDKESELIAEKARILEATGKAKDAYIQAKDEYIKAKAEYDAAARKIERDMEEAARKYQRDHGSKNNEIAMADRDIERLKAELAKPIADHCPTCKQLLPVEAQEHVKAERERIAERIGELSGVRINLSITIADMDAEHETEKKRFMDAIAAIKKPEAPEEPKASERSAPLYAELAHTGDKISALNQVYLSARQVVEMAERDGGKIADAEKAIEVLKSGIAKNTANRMVLEARLDSTAETALSNSERSHEAVAAEVQAVTSAIERAKSDIEHAEKAIEAHDQNVRAIEALKVEIDADRAELADWMMLEKAFSPDGIAALELDAICPSVAAVATDLLRDYEDGRYSLRFDTTRTGGKGNQIEDFLIMIVDSLDGDEQDFFTLSPGEAVWFRKALQDAFGIIRGNNANLKFLVWFVDEGDSKLSPEARIAYFRMLESAHTASTRRHTVLITHSTEIQAMLTQVIDVTKLEAPKAIALEVAA